MKLKKYSFNFREFLMKIFLASISHHQTIMELNWLLEGFRKIANWTSAALVVEELVVAVVAAVVVVAVVEIVVVAIAVSHD